MIHGLISGAAGALTGNWKMIAAGLGGLAIVAAAGAGFLYVRGLSDRVADLSTENARLDAAVQIERAGRRRLSDHLDDVVAEQERNNRRLDALADKAAAARQTARETAEIFAEHDLGRLLDERPDLLESRINRGTDRAIERVRDASRFDGDAAGD